MPGIGLALASALSWGCSDFLSGLMSRRLPLSTVLLTTQAAGVPLMLLAGLLYGVPSDWSFVPLACLAAPGILTGLGALFRGMAVGAVSIVAPISATGAAIPVLVGLVTGDSPTLLQGVGVLCALIGVMLASRPGAGSGDAGNARDAGNADVVSKRLVLAAGAGYGLVAALGFGVFYVVLRYASAAAGGDPYWPVLVARTTGTLIMLGIVVGSQRRPSLRAADGGVLVLAGGLDVAATTLYAAASVTGIGALAAVLSSLYPVTTIGLARAFLHERLARLQAMGVVSALAGVALIALR
jgi:drug/metabolite transporter (DMT)-like permease